MIVALLFVLDGLMGYSYYYHSSKKIEQVLKISVLINDSSLDEQARTSVKAMRQEIWAKDVLVIRWPGSGIML